MNQRIVLKESFVVILVMNLMKKMKGRHVLCLFQSENKYFRNCSFRTLTAEHNSNSNDSIDDVLEKNVDKRPKYKDLMNNIRRGIRTDDDVTTNKRVRFSK